jgi:uncharacterized protein YggT (Ycf19 family)
MAGPARYVSYAIMIYMILIFISSFLRRVNPRPGSAAYVTHRVLFVITEPYLSVIRRVTPKIERGTVDWTMVVGLTALFVVVQIIRLVS